MDIRGWPMDRILQLPDCCFGRRFSVCAAAGALQGGFEWDISEMALPEKFVLWEVMAASDIVGLAAALDYIRLALGDQLPVNAAMMNALEPLVPGLGARAADPRPIFPVSTPLRFHMRNPIHARGRRLVLEVKALEAKDVEVQVVCEVSSIPTEVPDWLLSEYHRSR